MFTTKKILSLICATLVITIMTTGCGKKSNDTREFFNMSYDPTRELFATYNDRFALHWHELTGEYLLCMNLHGGSWKQAQDVIDGIDADVVSLAFAADIDKIRRAGLIREGWMNAFPYHSAPYTSTIVFLVRKGNPKKIYDWDDLTRDNVLLVTMNPKISGGARWIYLSAWEYARRKFDGDEKQIKLFMQNIFKNIAAFDSSSRSATRSFVEKRQGDVLVTWENEALLTMKKQGGYFDIVRPSISILAEPKIAVVDEVVDRKGSRKIAEEYIRYLYSAEGQDIIARNFYRPRDLQVAQNYEEIFKPMNLFTIDEAFGGWEKAQQEHFANGGTFDQIYRN